MTTISESSSGLLKSLPSPEAIQMELERRRTNKILSYYPNKGKLRRELYLKHLAFFRAGATHRERLALAANRVGKTEGMGGYETVLHLTGQYPDWWEGRRFDHPISAIASGTTSKTTRNVIQKKLLGNYDDFGTGLIPKDSIIRWTPKPGVQDGVELIYVEHQPTGGTSLLTLNSYDQGRKAYEGEERHLIWLDEEPPIDLYTECLMRTMTVNGMVMCTFTPMEGMSDVILLYCPNGKLPDSGMGTDDDE